MSGVTSHLHRIDLRFERKRLEPGCLFDNLISIIPPSLKLHLVRSFKKPSHRGYFLREYTNKLRYEHDSRQGVAVEIYRNSRFCPHRAVVSFIPPHDMDTFPPREAHSLISFLERTYQTDHTIQLLELAYVFPQKAYSFNELFNKLYFPHKHDVTSDRILECATFGKRGSNNFVRLYRSANTQSFRLEYVVKGRKLRKLGMASLSDLFQNPEALTRLQKYAHRLTRPVSFIDKERFYAKLKPPISYTAEEFYQNEALIGLKKVVKSRSRRNQLRKHTPTDLYLLQDIANAARNLRRRLWRFRQAIEHDARPLQNSACSIPSEHLPKRGAVDTTPFTNSEGDVQHDNWYKERSTEKADNPDLTALLDLIASILVEQDFECGITGQPAIQTTNGTETVTQDHQISQ